MVRNVVSFSWRHRGVCRGAQLSQQSARAAAATDRRDAAIGEARVTPDRATILVGVQSRAATAAAAGADNARRQKAILDTLRALGSRRRSALDGELQRRSGDAVQPETGGSPPKVTGYTVTNTVRADVRRLDDVGAGHRRGAGQGRERDLEPPVLLVEGRFGSTCRTGCRSCRCASRRRGAGEGGWRKPGQSARAVDV